jgi:hypothetical protein
VLDSLLAKVLGEKGLEALKPLLKTEALSSFIIPKSIISFLKTASTGKVILPGFDSLLKTSSGYSGCTTINEVVYEFSKATDVEIAAIISVATGQEPKSDIKNLDLAKLSKTIELLVKSQQKVEQKEPIASVAKPLAPIKPLPQEGPVSSNVKRSIAKTMMVPEKGTEKVCKSCKKAMFTKKEFTGCTCLKALAKSVTSQTVAAGVLLSFGRDLDADAIDTIAELIND